MENRIDLGKCKQHDLDDNCFAKDNDINTDSPCTLCKKGSELIDGLCIESNVPLCENFQPKEEF